MRAGLIYNPSAGRGRGGAIASAVQQGLTRRGLDVELYATQRPTDAMVLAASLAQAVDIVVAIGGDGTINEVVNGMTVHGAPGAAEAAAPSSGAGVADATAEADATAAVAAVRPPGANAAATLPAAAPPTSEPPRHKALLGIVPAGTVNVFALELGLPYQVERACNAIAGDKTVSLDVGNINDRGFVLMTGAGIDALTVRNVDLRAKRRFRELAFLGTGLRWGLAADPPAFVVRAGGNEYTATFFVASNCRYYAGHLGLTPYADPTDGVLDLLIFTGTTRSSLAVFWLGVPSGLHLKSSNVTHIRAEEAELIPLNDKETVWFQTDGELAGRLPARVKIDARALEVLVP